MPPRNMKKHQRKPVGKVNDRQERFALEYVKDFDRVRAYRAAGYDVETDETAAVQACKLLKNPNVYAIVLREKARIANSMGWSADKTLIYLECVFVEAMKDKDYSSAVSALDKIAKFYGIYEKHNKQKSYTRDDVERLKGELRQAGFSFERVNFPSTN